MNLYDLSGKTAVIIGGNSTLGGAMAVALGGYGAEIAVVGRNADKVDEVRKKIDIEGGKSKGFSADATDIHDLEGVLSGVLDWTGRVDILMNCIGITSTTSFFDISMEEWDEIMDVNLKSVILSCQIFSKQMIQQGEGGSIINISSVSSDPPLSKVMAYSASKAAVNNVTKFLARELAPHRIRVNAIIPGFFLAEMNRNILSEERIQSILQHTPMGRFGDPSELQGTAVWLAAEQASGFVTGSLIRVDGGFGSMTI